MMTFRARWLLNLAAVSLCAMAVWFAYRLLQLQLQWTAYYTGWFLGVLLVLLTGYNVYKKMPSLPLLSSSVWLQFHLWAGWFTIFLFTVHIGGHWPHGMLGWLLLSLYSVVVASGIAGLALSRWLAPRLAVRGEQVIFERIPMRVRALQKEVEALVLQSVATATSTSISDYYARRLKAFFDRPQHFWRHLLQSDLPRRLILAETSEQQRYMDADERRLMEAIALRVGIKDDLDYHYAAQGILKYWLFIHVPLAYSLLIFVSLHIAVVYAFAG